MALTIIRAAALRGRPWPNGLGITRDVAAQNRSEAGFDWLISIADLVESAAFSHFSGVDRIFTLIEGDGVTLTVDGAAMPCRPFVPARFPGDRPTHCTMTGGPARAFNLFVDRAGFDAQVTTGTIAAGHAVGTGGDTVAVFCAAGTLDLGGQTLDAGDTALGRAAIRAIGGPATAIVVGVTARPG